MYLIARLSAFAVLIVAVIGCGGPHPRAVATGKVTIGGKDLTGGGITFALASDPTLVASGQIHADGSFDLGDVPVGECKVLVDTSGLLPNANTKNMPGGPGGAGGMPNMMGAPKTGAPGQSKPKDAAKAGGGGPPGSGGDTGEMGSNPYAGMKHVKIDPSFTKLDSTPLKATVSKGTNSFTFEVK